MFGKTKYLKINGEAISYDKTIFNKLHFVENIHDHYISVHNDYTDNIINPEGNNIIISGYNQNINLFNSIMDKLPNYLHFDDINIKNYILQKYPNIENSTLLCVRIGEDFKHMDKIKPETYFKAFEYLKADNEIINNVFIISDIPTHNYFNGNSQYFVEIDEPDIIQFYAGFFCKNIILSESTFHLWIAYLSTYYNNIPYRKVVCFNDTDITNRNLHLNDWIRLDY
jgi:hypothetical protein